MLFDLLFFFALLIGALVGIGAGVYVAFTMSMDDDEDGGHDHKDIATPFRRDKRGPAKSKRKERGPGFWERFGKSRKKQSLKAKIQKPEVDYSRFDCGFTGEDEDEKLQRVMREQNEGYHYLEGSGEG